MNKESLFLQGSIYIQKLQDLVVSGTICFEESASEKPNLCNRNTPRNHGLRRSPTEPGLGPKMVKGTAARNHGTDSDRNT